MKKQPIVAPAPQGQRVGKAQVSSGTKGKPFDVLLSKIEAEHPGIEKEIGVSSAAARAGRHVREMRLAKGLTQAQLAAALGWDQVRISNIERGEGTLGPTFDVLQKIATACSYDIEFKSRRAEKLLPYVNVLQNIAKLVADAGALSETMVATPQFAAACVAFGRSLGSAKTHFLALDASLVRQEMRDIPYFEMATKGKRMVMLPVLVEEAASQTTNKKSTELEVKLAVPTS
jgi:transcriptional regulator with XRE-family HTH domain